MICRGGPQDRVANADLGSAATAACPSGQGVLLFARERAALREMLSVAGHIKAY